MRRFKHIFLLTFVLIANTLSAQYIQLVENRGELGIMAGGAYYRGDIASDQIFYKPSFGAFYKKQFNDYVGLRLTYEYIALGANDLQSANNYDHARGLYFERTSHDISLMGEFYFLKFINGNRQFGFSPYLGFGIGGWKSISGLSNLPNPTTKKTVVFPINLGFKYNVIGPLNVFGEITYRFTNSDKLDYFSDQDAYTPNGNPTSFEASTSGNDQYFSTKLGISYNLLKIYGPDKPKKVKKSFFQSKQEQQNKPSRKSLFSFLKRN
jgi:hypothetical protein